MTLPGGPHSLEGIGTQNDAKPTWGKIGAWSLSTLLAIGLVGAVAPEFLRLYVCPDWDLKTSSACIVGWADLGWWMGAGSAASLLLFGFFIFVAPVLLVLLVMFTFLGGKK